MISDDLLVINYMLILTIVAMSFGVLVYVNVKIKLIRDEMRAGFGKINLINSFLAKEIIEVKKHNKKEGQVINMKRIK